MIARPTSRPKFRSVVLLALLGALSCCTLLVTAGSLTKYRLPNGEIGFTDSVRSLPSGAIVISGDGLRSFAQHLQMFMQLAASGEVEAAKDMLSRDFVRGVDADGHTALFGSLHSTELLNEVLVLGGNVHHRDNASVTALHYAASMSNRVELTTLLAWHADINVLNQAQQTPLMVAIDAGRTRNASYLIGKGADVNLLDAQGVSALLMAVRSGQQEVVTYLLEKGAKANVELPSGVTLLSIASRSGNRALADLLVSHGAAN